MMAGWMMWLDVLFGFMLLRISFLVCLLEVTFAAWVWY